MSYSIKEASEKLNISPHTLRYYEKEKVILSVNRNKNGVRRYSEHDINWLEFVNCFKETGMSLADIKRIVELSSGKNSDENIPRRLEILKNHKKKVLEKMDEMQKNLEKVNKKIQIYEEMTKKI